MNWKGGGEGNSVFLWDVVEVGSRFRFRVFGIRVLIFAERVRACVCQGVLFCVCGCVFDASDGRSAQLANTLTLYPDCVSYRDVPEMLERPFLAPLECIQREYAGRAADRSLLDGPDEGHSFLPI